MRYIPFVGVVLSHGKFCAGLTAKSVLASQINQFVVAKEHNRHSCGLAITRMGSAVETKPKTIPLARYLWERIAQVGVKSVFGVPGDFNLRLLDYVYDVAGLEWVGSTNELNAAYSADGYARVKSGAGCVVTTHGVGELSALNAIAGSMTEQVKVIHVVGQTSLTMQKNRMMIHHSIGSSPDHQLFNHASTEFRVAAAELHNAVFPTEEIDRVLRECFVRSGPVYIFIPIDLVGKHVSAAPLETPLDLKPPFDQSLLEDATTAILNELNSSKRPAIFVDCLVHRHNAVEECRQLADKLGIPIFVSNMGKGIIDESHPHYVGVCNGDPSPPGVKAAMEHCDLVLALGSLPADINSGGFTRPEDPDKDIYINPRDVQVRGQKEFTVPIKQLLQSLVAHADPDKIAQHAKVQLPDAVIEEDHDSKMITQSWIWKFLATSFLQPHDVVVGEAGTTTFGLTDCTFSPNINYVSQTYYCSIGWATPAAFGADLARVEAAKSSKRPRGRTILITGDGSLMLTVQEIGNMVKQKSAPIIFIINNSGYTIERIINGARQSYNDIVPFNYKHMLPFFNMPEEEARKNFHRCTTKAELEQVLILECVHSPQTVQIVEIVMDMMDVPCPLSAQIAAGGEAKIKEMADAGFKVSETPKGKEF